MRAIVTGPIHIIWNQLCPYAKKKNSFLLIPKSCLQSSNYKSIEKDELSLVRLLLLFLCRQQVEETIQHLFDCPLPISCRRMGELQVLAGTTTPYRKGNLLVLNRSLKLKFLMEIVMVACWHIFGFWKIRNNRIFSGVLAQVSTWKSNFLQTWLVRSLFHTPENKKKKQFLLSPYSGWSFIRRRECL